MSRNAISGAPDPVTYTVTASAAGYDSTSVRVTVSGLTDEKDFVLTASGGDDGGGGGGGFCPPGQARKGLC